MNADTPRLGDVQAALEAAQRQYDVLEIDGRKLMVASGQSGRVEITDLEPYSAQPSRVQTGHVFRTPKSLADYWSLYADEDSAAFCNADQRSVRIVLDYHEAGRGMSDNEPRHGSHEATLKARYSPAYEAWRTVHRKQIGQREALEFLEDRIIDITEPAAADVYDQVMKFEALNKVEFRSHQRLRDGTVQLHFSQEDAASGSATLPEKVKILVSVFEGLEPQPLDVRIRFRLRDGALFFAFVIANIEEAEREAFERLRDQFVTASGAERVFDV